MSDKIWEDIYNQLKKRWWGLFLLFAIFVFIVIFSLWNSLPDTTKDKIIFPNDTDANNKFEKKLRIQEKEDIEVASKFNASTNKKDNTSYKTVTKKDWLKQLLYNPIVPGSSIAGLNIGDSAITIESKLGIPTHDIEYMRVNINGKEGEIFGYRTQYKKSEVFFGVFSSKNDNKIESFRLYDRNFDKDKTMPNYKGITIGTTRVALLKKLGEPKHILHSDACASDMNSDGTTYMYDGISFEICSHNDLVWLIDVK